MMITRLKTILQRINSGSSAMLVRTSGSCLWEDDERIRLILIDISMVLLEFWGHIVIGFIIAIYVVYFINICIYCATFEEFSIDMVRNYIKYEVFDVDPVEEQKRLAHEALREKHRQAAEYIKQQEELAKRKPPSP
jgi:hypothetical protein